MQIKRVWKTTKTGSIKSFHFFKESITEWNDDRALRLSAALAFYSIFSLAPLLLIAIYIAGFVFGEQAVQGEIVYQIEEVVGVEGAMFIEDMLRRTRLQEGGVRASIIGLATTLFGSILVFNALQDTLNMIWGVRRRPKQGVLAFVIRRFLAFLMVLLIGIFLLASFMITTAIAAVEAYFYQFIEVPVHFWRALDMGIWFGFFTLSFAVMFKMLPDARIAWRDVWVGAGMTSILFGLGRYGISTYLAYSSAGSVFGAAGTLVILLTWIYYSWAIIFLGAEMTQVFARKFGKGIEPSKRAIVRGEPKPDPMRETHA